jgi:hypothetical protein
MPSILKQHVHYLAKADDGDSSLLRDGELLTGEAAELTKLTPERIRQLCKRHGIGRWVRTLQYYAVDRQPLLDHLAKSRRRRAK